MVSIWPPSFVLLRFKSIRNGVEIRRTALPWLNPQLSAKIPYRPGGGVRFALLHFISQLILMRYKPGPAYPVAMFKMFYPVYPTLALTGKRSSSEGF